MAKKIRHRIIIDTNIWISFLLRSNYSKFDLILSGENIVLLFSQQLIDEFIEVAERNKFRVFFPLSDLDDLLLNLRSKAKFVSVTSNVEICRDHKDNFLLSLAIDGKANFLITGDKDLLVLNKIEECEILTITEYLFRNRIKYLK